MNRITDLQIESELLVWHGRVLKKSNGIHFFYTGSGFDAKIEGSSLWATFETNDSEDNKRGYLNVAIKNHEVSLTYTYRLDQGKSTIQLFDLPYGIYSVSVRKQSESMMTRTVITELSTDGNWMMVNPARRSSIEWIGDSLTCGYGNLGENENTPFDTKDEDGMQSFAILASQALNMDYQLVSVSGIGVYKSFYAEVTMPSIYEQYDIYDRTPYPFTKHQDIVVINLGTNDHSYMNFLMDHSKVLEQEAFQKAYQAFVTRVKTLNPSSLIICISQGSRQMNVDVQIERAVQNINDSTIFHLRLSPIHEDEGIGSQYHPKVLTHRRWATEIQLFIQSII
jgi:lysophospholipase L1-like esterase